MKNDKSSVVIWCLVGLAQIFIYSLNFVTPLSIYIQIINGILIVFSIIMIGWCFELHTTQEMNGDVN